jgi:uncharacterized protein
MPAKPRAKTPSGTTGTKPCPICGKPSVAAAQPFCSDRCRDVDLNRWFSGSYVVPGRDDEEDEGG